MNVGIRAFKNSLSRYLRSARRGEPILITDRGTVVAELRGVDPEPRDAKEVLARLEREGDLVRGRGRCKDIVPLRTNKRVSLTEMVIEDRG